MLPIDRSIHPTDRQNSDATVLYFTSPSRNTFNCALQSSGVDVNRTMSGWLHQSGYPVLLVRVARDANGSARALELQQDRFVPWVPDAEPAATAASAAPGAGAVAAATCVPPDCQPAETCALRCVAFAADPM